MPCRDYYDDHPEQYYADTVRDLRKQISFAESALCAALRHIEKAYDADPVDYIGCDDAGINRTELKSWYKKHKALDTKHRAEEKKRLLRQQALEKLTPEERAALGVK
jgi:hypothetical protein